MPPFCQRLCIFLMLHRDDDKNASAHGTERERCLWSQNLREARAMPPQQRVSALLSDSLCSPGTESATGWVHDLRPPSIRRRRARRRRRHSRPRGTRDWRRQLRHRYRAVPGKTGLRGRQAGLLPAPAPLAPTRSSFASWPHACIFTRIFFLMAAMKPARSPRDGAKQTIAIAMVARERKALKIPAAAPAAMAYGAVRSRSSARQEDGRRKPMPWIRSAGEPATVQCLHAVLPCCTTLYPPCTLLRRASFKTECRPLHPTTSWWGLILLPARLFCLPCSKCMRT